MSELFIGLMSGTSIDAIDAVLVDLAEQPLKLIATHSIAIPTELKLAILELCQPIADEINRLGQLDVHLGQLFAEACQQLLRKADMSAEQICAIGSHGQTIRHQPNHAYPFTLQIGDPNHIAAKTQIRVVADFRRRDMAEGGQGAPLVPAFHNYLFRQPDKNRVVVNIGGIANITLLPGDIAKPVFGFDTGPGNTLLDAWIYQQQNKLLDQDGEWAASGNCDQVLLAQLLTDPYFAQSPPKSTGREHFNLDWLQAKITRPIKAPDLQATLVELTARTIVEAIQRLDYKDCEILICGGGVYNRYLMQRLQFLAQPCLVHSTAEFGIDPAWVEALAFAWLAQQTLLHKTGNLPEVTGAKRPAILGGVYFP